MKVFVTGASGYIGSAVVRELIEAGTGVLHPGQLVVIAPRGWHSYAPDPQFCATFIV